MKLITFGIIVALTANALADQNNYHQDEKINLSSLIVKQSKEIHSFSGLYFNVGILPTGKPDVEVTYMKIINNTPPVVNQKTVLLARDKTASAQETALENKITAIGNIAPAATVLAKNVFSDKRDCDEVWERNPSVVRFDFLDNQGKILSSEWRDTETGFKLMAAIYDSNGSLLDVTFFSKLRINGEVVGKSIPNFGKSIRVHFNQTPRFQGLDIKQIYEAKKFAKDLLATVAKQRGLNFE